MVPALHHAINATLSLRLLHRDGIYNLEEFESCRFFQFARSRVLWRAAHFAFLSRFRVPNPLCTRNPVAIDTGKQSKNQRRKSCIILRMTCSRVFVVIAYAYRAVRRATRVDSFGGKSRKKRLDFRAGKNRFSRGAISRSRSGAQKFQRGIFLVGAFHGRVQNLGPVRCLVMEVQKSSFCENRGGGLWKRPSCD